MTTPPAPGTPTLSLATDAASYIAGQQLTLTATYADSQSNPVTLTISASATDAAGNSASASTTVTVVEQASESMDVTPTDTFGDTYAAGSNTLANGTGTAVFTTTVTPPAGG
jgi:mevalonate kinase